MSATVTYILMGLAGFGLAIAGVYLLYGLPWGLLAGSASCFVIARFLKRGMAE